MEERPCQRREGFDKFVMNSQGTGQRSPTFERNRVSHHGDAVFYLHLPVAFQGMDITPTGLDLFQTPGLPFGLAHDLRILVSIVIRV